MVENHLGSGWTPRGPVAVQEDGFATRATASCTSTAQRLGGRAEMVQKIGKPAVVYKILLTISMKPTAKKKKTNPGQLWGHSKVCVWYNSGKHFIKSIKTENQKRARRRGESATTKRRIPRLSKNT